MKTFSDFRNYIKEKKDAHEIKKTSSDCQFSIFDSVEFIEEAVWDKLVPEEKGLMRLPYLKAVENSKDESDEFRYVIVYKDKKPVGAIVFHIFVLDGSDYRGKVNAKNKLLLKTQEIASDLSKNIKVRVLLCGNAHLSGDHGFYYNSELSSEEAYHALADACYRVRRAEKLRGQIQLQLIKDFYLDEFEQSSDLIPFGYKKFKVDPNMSLTLKSEWKCFDDYLNAMRSKYKKKVTSAVKKGMDIKRVELSASEIRENYERIQELYDNVAAKAKFRIISIKPNYFIELKNEMQDDFKFIGYYLEDKLVGFSTMVLWGDNLEGHTIGLDYDYNTKHSIYQNILYDDVKYLFEFSKKKLILGRTAMEMKSNIGAVPEDMWCYMRHPQPLANRLIAPIFKYIKQTEWEPRNPFKE